jgi:hypothetical protein
VSIYVLCIAVLVAATPLAWWIKREGERSWARHQRMVAEARRREQMAALSKAFVNVSIVFRDQLTPAFQRVGLAVGRMAEALREASAGDAS